MIVTADLGWEEICRWFLQKYQHQLDTIHGEGEVTLTIYKSLAVDAYEEGLQ